MKENKPPCETGENKTFDLNGNCISCKEGCEYWFIEDLREAGFKGIIFGVGDKVIEL